MSEQGKDKVFLAYANYSLREDPKNFFKIYDVVNRCHPFLVHTKNLRLVIEVVVAITSFGGPDNKVRDDDVLRIAQEAVYGYRDGFCEKTCSMRELREENWGREPFEGPDRWKCIECDQCDFIRMLIEVTDGKPYSEIEGFLRLIGAGLQFPEKTLGPYEIEVVLPPKKSIKKLEDLFPKPKRYASYKPRDPISPEDADLKLSFRNYWSALIGYSLAQFLDDDDLNRQRLKLCPECLTFFIAADAKRQICYSQSCEKARQRDQKRPYMRKKRHPFSRKFDPKYDRRKSKES